MPSVFFQSSLSLYCMHLMLHEWKVWCFWCHPALLSHNCTPINVVTITTVEGSTYDDKFGSFVQFLEGCTIGEGHVRLVKDPNGQFTGEAFIDCPSAESVARGMVLDRTAMGDSGVFVSVVSSSVEDRNSLMQGGCTLV